LILARVIVHDGGMQKTNPRQMAKATQTFE